MSAVNGAVEAMVRAFAVELAPIRVNALHPGIVGDSPAWSSRADALEAIRQRTPTGRTIALAEMADGVLFLLENGAANGVNLTLDGGWLLT